MKKLDYSQFGTVAIELLKKGDIFRLVGKNTVYVKERYNRELKKYEYSKWDDISAYSSKKKGTLVEIGFDF